MGWEVMKKEVSFWKILGVFLLMVFSMHIFVMDLEIMRPNFFAIENEMYRFNLTFWESMEDFHSTWVILGIFIFYFYYHVYFIKDHLGEKKKIISLVAIVISIMILVGKSYYYYGNLDMIFSSNVQIFKCFLVGFGYYFMIYAILKWINCSDKKLVRGRKL